MLQWSHPIISDWNGLARSVLSHFISHSQMIPSIQTMFPEHNGHVSKQALEKCHAISAPTTFPLSVCLSLSRHSFSLRPLVSNIGHFWDTILASGHLFWWFSLPSRRFSPFSFLYILSSFPSIIFFSFFSSSLNYDFFTYMLISLCLCPWILSSFPYLTPHFSLLF